MTIYSKPEKEAHENEYGIKVLFLHGLEGSPTGSKAIFLRDKWAALCPMLRTSAPRDLSDSCSGDWSLVDQAQIDEALSDAYDDVKDAARYSSPDVIVGSSLGGALLFRLISDGLHEGSSVFCAPSIDGLVSPDVVINSVTSHKSVFSKSVWLLGELDTVVSNPYNVRVAKKLGASVLFSPDDDHRLNKSINSNILNAAVLTAIELSGR